jgi:hypothetical protein
VNVSKQNVLSKYGFIMDYIDGWANSLGLADPWQEMQRQIADILRGDDSL